MNRPTTQMLAASFVLLTSSFSNGQRCTSEYFVEPFQDSLFDGNPVTWEHIGNVALSELSVENDELQITTRGGTYVGASRNSNGNCLRYDDLSVLTQLRAVDFPDDAMFAGILGRVNGLSSYYIGISPSKGEIRYGESFFDGSMNELGVNVDFDVRTSDVVLRLDMQGESIQGWAWEAGSTMPVTPLFKFEDESLKSGQVGLWVNTPSRAVGSAAIASFEVAPVPEPTGLTSYLFGAVLIGWSRRRHQ